MDFEKYFQSYEEYFWEWDNRVFSLEEVFESITIPNGPTIVYEKLVFDILDLLSEDSIPPFGSLLLAIIATNPESTVAIELVQDIVKGKVKINAFPNGNLFRLGASIDFMKLLSYLPEEYKTGDKRIQLFQTIFHSCHNRIAKDRAKKILEESKNNRHHLVIAGQKTAFNDANFIKDFRTLALLKVKFPSTQSIINAMKNLPEQAIKEQIGEVVLEQNIVSDKPKDFIEELIANDKTFHVGSLIKRIWTGLNIPLHHNMPSQQPLGGISDLTNKGDFDKLLLSEFANDDDVFMLRLANNEALYIQREVPPEADKFTRIILIDSSLKNWGNPKTLAYATSLAIAKHPKTDIVCQLFALGKQYDEVYFNTVHEVINGLNVLSGHLDCSEGLNSYLSTNDSKNKDHEIFFITSEDSLKLVPMQKVMSDHFEAIKYVVSTNYDGNINFYRNQNKGRKHIQHILLPLEELWERKVNKQFKPNIIRKTVNEEVLVFSYPILFDICNFPNIEFAIDNDLYILTPENNIFKQIVLEDVTYKNAKFQFIFQGIQRKSTYGSIGISDQDGYLYLNYDFLNKEFVLTNLSNNIEYKVGYVYKKFRHEFGKVVFENRTEQKHFWFLDDENVLSLTFEKEVLSLNKINRNINSYRGFYNEKTNYTGLIKYGRNINVLKNINRVYINEKNFLVLNNFSIITRSYNKEDYFFTLTDDHKSNSKIRSKFKNGRFEFPDGSLIYQNRSGMLILASSIENFPLIYFPLVLNKHIGISTNEKFTGNQEFLPPHHNLEIISEGDFYELYVQPFIQNILDYGT